MVRCTVLAAEGEDNLGHYWFQATPRRGDTVEVLDRVFKVAEVRHLPVEAVGEVGDVILFVRPNP